MSRDKEAFLTMFSKRVYDCVYEKIVEDVQRSHGAAAVPVAM